MAVITRWAWDGRPHQLAPMFEKKLPRLLQHDYSNPNFPTAHLLKDVKLCLQNAQEENLETAFLDGIREVLEKAMAQGSQDLDYSSVFETIVGREKGEA